MDNFEFCYTCLKVGVIGDKFISLNFAVPEDISYKNKLKSCVPEMGVENNSDCFLCNSCTTSLETAYTFRSMCLRTDGRLDEFRKTHSKKIAVPNRSIKQELIESVVGNAEDTSEMSTEMYTTRSSVALAIESRPAEVSIQAKQSNDVSSSLSQTSIPAPHEKVLYSPGVSKLSQDDSRDDPTIDIVKNELGCSLTEGIEGVLDIEVEIFDRKEAMHFPNTNNSSRSNSFDSFDQEVEEFKKSSSCKVDELEVLVLPEPPKTPDLPKDEGFKSPQFRKPLSDEEIIKICCKTIPDLFNCPPKALDCRVSLEKIKVSTSTLPLLQNSKKKKAKTYANKYSRGKPFWCPICHKNVHRKDRFNSHMLKHSNIKGYKCNTCWEGFFSREGLYKHQRMCTNVRKGAGLINNITDASSTSLDHASGDDNMMPAVSILASPTVPRNNFAIKTSNRIRARRIASMANLKKVIKIEDDTTEVPTHTTEDPTYTIEVPVSTEVNSYKADTEQPTAKQKSGIGSRKKIRKSKKKRFRLNDTVYRCRQCIFQTLFKQKFHVHMLRHNNERPHVCTECPKKFFERWELTRHIRATHPDQTDIDSEHVSNISKSVTLIVKKKPSTRQNDKSRIENSLPSFMEPAISLIVNPRKVVTPIIQSIHSLAQTSIHDESIEMSFACKLCNISFKSRNLLMLHTQTHELKRSCITCGVEFTSENDVLNHECIQEIEEDTNESNETVSLEAAPKLPSKKKKKKFFCNICNMEFSSRDHANTHTGAKPYPCKVCGKPFGAYTTLRKHKMIHQYEDKGSGSQRKGKRQIHPERKTYDCEICKKKFVNKEYVYSHSCQSSSGDTVYRCQICKNPFIGRAALIEHMGVHVSQNITIK